MYTRKKFIPKPMPKFVPSHFVWSYRNARTKVSVSSLIPQKNDLAYHIYTKNQNQKKPDLTVKKRKKRKNKKKTTTTTQYRQVLKKNFKI